MLSLPLKVLFGSDGDYLAWALGGWSADPNDRTHTWIEGHVAKLRLPLDAATNNRILIVEVIPHEKREQDLFVFLNGSFAAFWNIKYPTEVTSSIDDDLFKAGNNVFAFVAPRAVRPADLREAGDARTLGCAFKSLALLEA
jgi:hypothetical protein